MAVSTVRQNAVFAGYRAGDMCLRQGVIAANVELKNAQRAGRSLGNLLEPGSDTELSIWAAPNAPVPRATAAAPAGSKISTRRPVRASPARNLRPKTSTDASTLATLRQHPRPECNLVEPMRLRRMVGLGLGVRRQCSPGITG